MSIRSIDKHSLAQIKNFEGLRLTAYRDVGGVLTIGYGHTAGVTEGETITSTQAENLLLNDLVEYEKCVDDEVKVPLTDNQFGALVSFCYNVGVPSFKRSTLLKRLNAGKFQDVPQEMMRWVYIKRRKNMGLYHRRLHECSMWLGNYCRNCDIEVLGTPKPETHFSTFLGKLQLGTALTSIAYAASTAADSISVYANSFATVQKLFISLIVISTIASFLLSVFKNKK